MIGLIINWIKRNKLTNFLILIIFFLFLFLKTEGLTSFPFTLNKGDYDLKTEKFGIGEAST